MIHILQMENLSCTAVLHRPNRVVVVLLALLKGEKWDVHFIGICKTCEGRISKRSIYKKLESVNNFYPRSITFVILVFFDRNFICHRVNSPLGVIHEHDFLSIGINSHFVQCRTCDVAYCILCGKKVITIMTRRDHGFGKCIRIYRHRPKAPFQ